MIKKMLLSFSIITLLFICVGVYVTLFNLLNDDKEATQQEINSTSEEQNKVQKTAEEKEKEPSNEVKQEEETLNEAEGEIQSPENDQNEYREDKGEPLINQETFNLEGVITWQYNDFIGTKPDVGAKIFLIPRDFNPTNFKQIDLEGYSMIGIAPKNSNLFYTEANGYGNYKLKNIPVGEYILVVSSKKTTRDPDGEVIIEDILKERLGKAYDQFFLFNVGDYKNYTWSFIEVQKNETIEFSHDFGYSYM